MHVVPTKDSLEVGTMAVLVWVLALVGATQGTSAGTLEVGLVVADVAPGLPLRPTEGVPWHRVNGPGHL